MVHRASPAPRALPTLLAAAVACLCCRLLLDGCSFVSGGPRGFQGPSDSSPRSTALRAEEEGEGDGGVIGGFLKSFPKLDTGGDIELSPEEYKLALDSEIETQRKKYYIGGEVNEKKLVVPWRKVDEKVLEKDARRALKKNGIKDPQAPDVAEEDSTIKLSNLGPNDVMVEWTTGEQGQKVGYIVERKLATDMNFQEIATYDQLKNPQLISRPKGTPYFWQDEMLPPGLYTYRVLCRYRSGELLLVDQKDIRVSESGGLPEWLSVTLVFSIGFIIWFAFDKIDPPIRE